MPPLTKLLVKLERYDTYQAQDALNAALKESLGDEELPEPTQKAAGFLWNEWLKSDTGYLVWQAWVTWADERLTAWHSLKVNAIESAWTADPKGEDLQVMIDRVTINLRQGLNDEPSLLPDAFFLQSLAQQGHPFTFTQALKALRQEGLNLPPDQELKKHCAISAHAFKYLTG